MEIVITLVHFHEYRETRDQKNRLIKGYLFFLGPKRVEACGARARALRVFALFL